MTTPFRKKGFALVITLMLIVLVAVFITATLSTVGTDTQATDANASAENAKRLADVAVQTVISQLQEATTQGSTIAWASQPGMIRCYDNQGKEKTWYKLYSAEQMIQAAPTSSGLGQLTADLPTGAWDGGGVFTDLNSPVLAADGNTKVYPIMDPTGAKFSNNAAKAIPGFDIDQTARPTGSNTAPMPVRWLYVLRDGTLVPGTSGGSGGSITVAGAGKSNPIVGRVAFWTDDETCKLNINTAGDGTYFDSPRFDSAKPVKNPTTAQIIGDRQFAVTPPAAREFQRYIGHPAQTRLSTVIPELNKSAVAPFVKSRAMTSVSPFLQWGGSQGGTLTFWDLEGKLEDPSIMASPVRATPYATLDEWIFSQNVSSNQRSANTFIDANGTQQQLVTRNDLGRLRFVLTASSEAPEINLFGKPRLAIWPIHNDFLTNPASVYTTRFDRMIASTSTLNAAAARPDTYFFTRADPTSPTFDYDNIGRNQDLFGYLRRLSATNIPGFGSNFVSKYSRVGADQILTEIFDYIRSTNIVDAMLFDSDPTKDHTFSSFQPTAMVGYYQSGPVGKEDLGRGQVTPIYITDYNTKGFGRFYTIDEIGLNFGWADAVIIPPAKAGDPSTADPTQWYIAPAIQVSLFSPSMGPPRLNPSIRIEIEDLDSLKVALSDGTEQQLFGPPNEVVAGRKVYSARPKASDWHAGTWYPFFWGGIGGPRLLYNGKGVNYPFYGRTFLVKKDAKMSFSGKLLKVKVFWDNQTTPTGSDGIPGLPSYLVQEFSIYLPAFSNLPTPTNSATADSNGKYTAEYYFRERLNSAFYGPTDANRKPVSEQSSNIKDTVRASVAKYNGDLRLVAAQRIVPQSAFAEHPKSVSNPTIQNAHSFRDPFPAAGFRVADGFASTGQPVKSVTYNTEFQPVAGIVDDPDQPDQTGDWDNGLGIIPDGPYINKPDEVGLQYFYYKDWASDTYTYYMQGNQGSITNARGYSSPNRNLASPVMFGSLSTGVPVGGLAAVPWRTLLFRPQQNHFGQTTDPKDYLLLDWFWMPVVEPYAISTTFATAGKVNMNYQLAPFTYVTRATALIGTLGSEYVIAVPTADAGKYKSRTTTGNATLNYRSPVKVLESDGVTAGQSTGTLRQFKELFDKGEIFRSAAQICGIYLVPDNQSWTSDSQAESFWSNNKLTGDNTRERPYNGLYSRLTTKSNTYTVHVRVQVLKPDPNGPEGIWTENAKRIASEYRGSYTVNRYLDREQDMPDFASASNFDKSIEGYYRYRILDSRAFQP